MGTLRKMGAFLGLVPDDQRYSADGAEHDQAGHDYPGDYHGYDDAHDAGGYAADGYQGEYAADGYRADDDADDRDGGYSADYRAGYGDRGGYADDGADFQADGGDYAADRGEYVEGDQDYRAPEPAYAGASAAAEPAMRPSAGGTRRSSRGGGSRDRSTEADYHTQGALAVQPQVYQAEAPMELSSANAKPATVKLTGFGDAREVGESYRDGQAVILDMTDLTDSEARRMVDFAAGLAFAVHGSIDKVTTKVFMLHQPTADPAH